MVLEDMELIDRGLPPLRGKRAERETVRACAPSRSTATDGSAFAAGPREGRCPRKKQAGGG